MVGRWLWGLFARDINAVPHASIPLAQISLGSAAAIILAIVVAVLPGRAAARTPTALLLRAE